MPRLAAVLLAILTAAVLSACGEESTDEGQDVATTPKWSYSQVRGEMAGA